MVLEYMEPAFSMVHQCIIYDRSRLRRPRHQNSPIFPSKTPFLTSFLQLRSVYISVAMMGVIIYFNFI
ncbi:hypothetical protein BDZ97DRAFT_1742134 [Flammula alnicola]|nr:hypothetical protein BDZ97DRAFT_1742134 [Flammula alnicola]